MDMYKVLEWTENRLKDFKYSKKFNIWKSRAIALCDTQERFIRIDKDKCNWIEWQNFKWLPSDQLTSLMDWTDDRWFGSIKETDIVLDLGAGIGSWCIPVSRMCKKVYAVEPLYWEELIMNIGLNKINNIEVIPIAIGSSKEVKWVRFGNKKMIMSWISLKELIDKIEKPDIIKVDIEGAEWELQPKDLIGIRDIRIEFHLRRFKRDRLKIHKWIKLFIENGYNFKLIDMREHETTSLTIGSVEYMRFWKE